MPSAKKIKKKKISQQQNTSGIQGKAVQRKSTKSLAGRYSSTSIFPESKLFNGITFLSLVIITLLVYSGDLQIGFFAVDDPGYVTDNPWIQGFTSENIKQILSKPYFANYSPVHLFSYMMDYGFNGADPYIFHLSNNIWAGIVAGLVYFVALALTQHRWAAIVAGLLFVIHPVHVEAVVWISSRKDLVAAAFALPSFLAYIKYRQDTNNSKKWYFISLFLFALAAAGKLSVSTFFGVYIAYDLFIEKRPFLKSLIGKIPFVLVSLAIALAAASAQPSMGNKFDFYVMAIAFFQNSWLLTGFGEYLLFRMPPQAGNVPLQVLGFVFFIAVFLAPLLLKHRWPRITLLVYLILFAFIPTQALSFTHPVTDRYLFFPSIAVTILISFGLLFFYNKFGNAGRIGALLGSVIIAVIWLQKTLSYINEWKDPRSVWYAASSKTEDPVPFQNLGTHYLNQVDHITKSQNTNTPVNNNVKALAAIVWQNDTRLPNLLSQWNRGQHKTREEIEFQNHLNSLSLAALEQSLKRKGNRNMPGLYYNMGLIYLKRGEFEAARKYFMITLNEAAGESFADVRNQLTVYCYFDLGIIEWRQANYPEALKWIKKAEEHQMSAGGKWVPDVSLNRKQLEQIIASQKK